MDCSMPGSSVQHLCKSLFLELRSALLLQPPDWGSSGQGAACSSGLWPGLPGTGQTGLAGADGCFAASGAQVPGDLCHSVPHKSCRQPHATARPHLEGMTSPSGPGHNLVWVSVCPKQTARSQKTAQLLLPTTTQVTRQMASSAWPASSGWLPVPELTGWPAERSWLILPLAPAVTPRPPPPLDGNQMTTFSRASEVGETMGAGPTPSGQTSPWPPGLWILALFPSADPHHGAPGLTAQSPKSRGG